MKKLGWTFFAAALTIMATDFVIHGWIMKSTYQATAHLWRPEAEMPQYMVWMFGGQLLTALLFTWIFSYGYQGKGWMEGVRYGLLIGAFEAGHQMMMYAVSPYDMTLLMSWIFWGVLQTVVVGVVAAWVWGKWWTGTSPTASHA